MIEAELARVRATSRGRLLVVRGRRRVGKSRLVEEFLRRRPERAVFFAASRQSTERELGLFQKDVASSTLPARTLLEGGGLSFSSWEAALNICTTGLDVAEPGVVVVDEFPYLLADPAVEGAFQKAWDRFLTDRPVLLVLIGSDLSAMEALTAYERPLYGRVDREMVVNPLSPAVLGSMLGLPAAEALDAHLVLGGFPQLAERWTDTLDAFVVSELSDPTSPFIVNAERALAAELPGEAQARIVCETIGYGQRTFSDISRLSGIGQSSLQRSLDILKGKRLVRQTTPLSARPSRESHYAIADPYLRFWLKFVRPNLELIERGRGVSVAHGVLEAWPQYRGIAIEPTVREAVETLASEGLAPDTVSVGSYWTRRHDVEVDLVGLGRGKTPSVTLVGSIKWREAAPFDDREAQALTEARAAVPGGEKAPRVAVSRSGFDTSAVEMTLGPEDLMASWRKDLDV
jgi:hypothetical protein